MIAIEAEAFGTVLKGLEKKLGEPEIKERIGTIQTTTLLRSARMLRRFLESVGSLLSQGDKSSENKKKKKLLKLVWNARTIWK